MNMKFSCTLMIMGTAIYAGGNPSKDKGAYFLTSRTLVRKPNTVLDEKQKKQIEEYRKWWITG